MKKTTHYLIGMLLVLGGLPALAETKTVSSPDANILVSVNDTGGIPHYSVSYRGEAVIKDSVLGLEFKDIEGFVRDLHIVKSEEKASDSTWEQPWGERRFVRDNHRELIVDFQLGHADHRHFTLHVKAFNDGIGFRYEVPKQSGLDRVDIVDEKTEFFIPDSDHVTAWWIPGRATHIDEYLYNTTSLTKMTRAQTPATFRLASGVHLSIHEAALVDYAAFTLYPREPDHVSGHLKADLTPWYDGIRVHTQTPFVTPWRTIQIAPNAVGLINSDLILNLNEPNKLGDVSWVKP